MPRKTFFSKTFIFCLTYPQKYDIIIVHNKTHTERKRFNWRLLVRTMSSSFLFVFIEFPIRFLSFFIQEVKCQIKK